MTDRTFYSSSKTAEQRYLSTFTESKEDITITHTMCDEYKVPHLEGSFRCIEAIYQAFKFLHLMKGRGDHTNTINQFKSGGTFALGLAAKRAGSRKGMIHLLARLDVAAWTKERQLAIMKMAIVARATVDKVYCDALVRSRIEQFTWLHIETRKKEVECFWGGFYNKKKEWVGQNHLGRLMAEVGDLMADPHMIDNL